MQIYLSHAYEDAAIARKVAKLLRAEGLDVWQAQTEVLPGDNWAEKISQALNESHAMIVLLTPEALRSPPVRHEIEFALGNINFRNRLVSVLVGPPEKISLDAIPWILRNLPVVRMAQLEPADEVIKEITRALLEPA